MECNKDEATRTKEIEGKKFAAKDMLGARKLALKSQKMCPEMKGIPQMIATLDVFVSAENKVSGELDWCGILGVNPFADEETVRKHYKKLVLMLHPDKNDFVGADGAFKLIYEAWGLLSDKSKRVAYDQRRSIHLYHKVSSQRNGVASTTPGSDGFCNFSKSSVDTRGRTPKTGQSSTPASCHNPGAYTGAASTTPAPNGFCNFSKPSVKKTRGRTSKAPASSHKPEAYTGVASTTPASNGFCNFSTSSMKKTCGRTSEAAHSGTPPSSHKPEAYTSPTPGSNGFCNFNKPSAETLERTPKAGDSRTRAPSHKPKPNTNGFCNFTKSSVETDEMSRETDSTIPASPSKPMHEEIWTECDQFVETANPPSNGTTSPQQPRDSYRDAGKREVVSSRKKWFLDYLRVSSLTL